MTYRVITGYLIARTAVHVGSGQAGNITDALLRRNAAGEVLIPGTAIAGVLRALITRLAPRLGFHVCKSLQEQDENPCECPVCALFGNINQSDEQSSTTGASRVLVFDARSADLITTGQLRDGVGIDRVTGAAARASMSKFDLETLPRDSCFEFRIELRDDVSTSGEQLLAAALAEWEAGRVWLGGRVARGMGAFTLKQIALIVHPLDTSNQVLAFLKSDKPWHIEPAERAGKEEIYQSWRNTQLAVSAETLIPADATPPVSARSWVQAEFTLAATGAFLTHDAVSATQSGFDHAPLLVKPEDWLNPVLAGASLRGVLRSQAERIARTLATHATWQHPENERQAHFKNICPACDPGARRKQKTNPVPLESCDSLLRYEKNYPGTTRIDEEHLCLACRLFGSTRRGSRLLVEDASFNGGIPLYKMLDFLAIDRFTGGGADKLKFDALTLWKPTFQVRMHLDNPQPWELGWLALVLRDLQEGCLSVGYGAAKGFGRVTIASDWKLTLGILDANDFPLPDENEAAQVAAHHLVTQARSTPTLYKELTYAKSEQSRWLTVAQGWVQKFVTKVQKTGGRWAELPLSEDSYFSDTKLPDLYPPYFGAEK